MLLDVKGNRIMKKKSKLQKTQDSGRNTLIAIFVIGIAVI